MQSVHTPSHRTAALVFALALFAAPVFAQPVLITANATVGPTDSTIMPTAGGPAVPLATAQITVTGVAQLTMSGRHSVASLSLSNSSRLQHAAGATFDYGDEVVEGLKLNVTGNVAIGASAAIELTGLGFPGGQGPGAGVSAAPGAYGGGGGHGGTGSINVAAAPGGQPYGSFTQPIAHGSGGGFSQGGSTGGSGGGSLRLIINGALTLDGAVRANGTALAGSGGAGGSVCITAAAISGTGTIQCNGGNSTTDGSGGRIAIEAPTCTLNTSAITALGPDGASPGTVYLAINGAAPQLIFDDNNDAGAATTRTPSAESLIVTGDLIVRECLLTTFESINVTGNVSIPTNGTIDRSGFGFAGSQGPGAGADAAPGAYGGGGGHGGTGSTNIASSPGGQPYGSFSQPTTPGSGGGFSQGGSVGGEGGGVLRLNCGNTLTLDGIIAANGYVAGGSGGAGGSIWITAASINGSGAIRANGGGSTSDGAGGRIAVEAANCTISDSSITTSGPDGASPGSVYLAINGASPLLIFDDNSDVGAATTRTPSSESLSVTGDILIRECLLTTFDFVSATGAITVSSNGTIDRSGFGYAGSEGPGAGTDAAPGAYGGGGGHGGTGSTNTAISPGGQPYGSFAQPITAGSGGGFSQGGSIGGSGGGVLRIIANDALTVNGTIAADGYIDGGGGGAGGSIWITAGSLAGTGSIHANGGSTISDGAGGRIAVEAATSTFADSSIAAIGPDSGAPGTVYLTINGAAPLLIFDDNNDVGTLTNRTLSAESIVVPGDVLVRECLLTTFESVTAEGNFTIAASGSIDVSGNGYPASEGPGAGADAAPGAYGGGGGHGGAGSTNSPSAPGGSTYGSFAQPTTPGSGGGFSQGSVTGGAGGGVLRLAVNDTLTVNGVIASDGTTPGGAGGSGGSIWITTNTLAGTGTIHANGGSTTSDGGGGRIALYSCFSSLPNANTLALGPDGAEDGSVFISTTGAEILPLTDAICGGGEASFTVRAGGVGELSYQWRRNGSPLTDGVLPSGATINGSDTATLLVSGFTPAEVGDYDVLVTAFCGSAFSNAVTADFCLSDVDCDQDADSDDIINFFAAWEMGEADVDYDGDTDSDDIIVFFAAWESGC